MADYYIWHKPHYGNGGSFVNGMSETIFVGMLSFPDKFGRFIITKEGNENFPILSDSFKISGKGAYNENDIENGRGSPGKYIMRRRNVLLEENPIEGVLFFDSDDKKMRIKPVKTEEPVKKYHLNEILYLVEFPLAYWEGELPGLKSVSKHLLDELRSRADSGAMGATA